MLCPVVETLRTNSAPVFPALMVRVWWCTYDLRMHVSRTSHNLTEFRRHRQQSKIKRWGEQFKQVKATFREGACKLRDARAHKCMLQRADFGASM